MLEPYRVLDLTDERGLLCGRILADLGADVVAVEPPGGALARRCGPFAGDAVGPEQSLYWQAYARGKRSITLDIETDEGTTDLLELVRGADFLIESFAPGYLNGLGLGYEQLRQVNPRLVMVSITPFGQTGPKAGWAATDLTVLASSGALLITGDEDRPPVRLCVPQAFLHAGAEAAAGALIAHAARERDGVGQHVDVSAQTAAMIATQFTILAEGWGERPLQRVAGGIKVGPIHLQFIHPCLDGHVSISLLFGTAFAVHAGRLMRLLFELGYVDAATRDKDWTNYALLLLSGQEPTSELARVLAAVSAYAATRTKAEIFATSMERGLLNVPVATTADLLDSAQLAARGYWTSVEQPSGPVLHAGPFARFSAAPIRYARPAPRIGEHNDEVRREWHVAGTTTSDVAGPRSSAPGATRSPALAGLKVLDFTWVVVGPSGVRYLADYGATVVHVESTTRIDPGRSFQPYKDGQPGAERSGLYANAQANKLGVTLNLAKPEAREVVRKLARWADVIVESYSPRAMRNWGLGYEALRELNPGLIMMSTCLNGQTGPWASLAGYGTMGVAFAGFTELAGWPDRMPAGPAGAYTDYVAPKFIAAALLAALDHRRRTGEGQYIDLAQAEASMHFIAPALLDYTVNGRVDTRTGNHSSEHAPHGVYPCRGPDRWVAIACGTEAEWRALCDAAGHAEWVADPRFATFAARQTHRDALDAALAGWTATLSVEALEETLQRVNVPVHRVTSSADAFTDPQLAHRGHIVTVDHPLLGPVPLESSRLRLSGTPADLLVPGAPYGRDNEHVLRDLLGLSDDEIVELAVAGALE